MWQEFSSPKEQISENGTCPKMQDGALGNKNMMLNTIDASEFSNNDSERIMVDESGHQKMINYPSF